MSDPLWDPFSNSFFFRSAWHSLEYHVSHFLCRCCAARGSPLRLDIAQFDWHKLVWLSHVSEGTVQHELIPRWILLHIDLKVFMIWHLQTEHIQDFGLILTTILIVLVSQGLCRSLFSDTNSWGADVFYSMHPEVVGLKLGDRPAGYHVTGCPSLGIWIYWVLYRHQARHLERCSPTMYCTWLCDLAGRWTDLGLLKMMMKSRLFFRLKSSWGTFTLSF